jgi:hypothetical protein
MTEPTPAPTHVLFTLKSGAEVHVPMPPAGMAGFVEAMEKSGGYRDGGQIVIWPDVVGDGEPTAIIVVSEIAAVQPSWGGLLDRVISYPRTS